MVPFLYYIISDEIFLYFIYAFQISNIITLMNARNIKWIFPVIMFKKMSNVAEDFKYSKISSDIVKPQIYLFVLNIWFSLMVNKGALWILKLYFKIYYFRTIFALNISNSSFIHYKVSFVNCCNPDIWKEWFKLYWCKNKKLHLFVWIKITIHEILTFKVFF